MENQKNRTKKNKLILPEDLEGFLIQHPSASVAVPPRLPREVLGVLGEAATVTKQYNFDATVGRQRVEAMVGQIPAVTGRASVELEH